MVFIVVLFVSIIVVVHLIAFISHVPFFPLKAKCVCMRGILIESQHKMVIHTTSICMNFGRSCTVEEKNSQEGASFVHDQKYITLSDPNYKSLLTFLENPKKAK